MEPEKTPRKMIESKDFSRQVLENAPTGLEFDCHCIIYDEPIEEWNMPVFARYSLSFEKHSFTDVFNTFLWQRNDEHKRSKFIYEIATALHSHPFYRCSKIQYFFPGLPDKFYPTPDHEFINSGNAINPIEHAMRSAGAVRSLLIKPHPEDRNHFMQMYMNLPNQPFKKVTEFVYTTNGQDELFFPIPTRVIIKIEFTLTVK